MSRYVGRHARRQRSLFGHWKRKILLALAIVVLVVGLVIDPFSQSRAALVTASSRGVSLQPEKKLYQFGEEPALLLRFQHPSPRGATGLLQLLEAPKAYAATTPKIGVTYNDHPANVTTSIKPQGNNYLLTLHPSAVLKPGTYKVKVSGVIPGGGIFTQTTTFAWGDLALNTDRTTYLPGEPVHMQMAALDSLGHTLCTAPLQVTITDPSGATAHIPYKPSTECQSNNFTAVPDYTAEYTPTKLGKYAVSLGIQGTAYAITDNFSVRSSVPFDISRTALTRVDPAHTYGVSITVRPNQNFNGTVNEAVSSSKFTILQHPGASVQAKDGKEVLQWHVNWHTGNTYTLTYQYMPPRVSPALYTLGPLQLVNDSGQPVFQETRAWQIAADFIITFIKQTVVDVTTASTTNTTSVTSTAGDTLILVVASAGGGSASELSTVTDNTGETWTVPSAYPSPTTNPGTTPPGNFIAGTNSNVAMAYKANANAITSITVTIGASKAFAYDLLEFSNIDSLSPVDQTASTSNGTASTTHTTYGITATTCDKPATAQLLRGGDFFCQSVNELVIGMVNAGNNLSTSPPLLTAGFTATTPGLNPGNGVDQASAAYKVTSTSGTYSISWSTSAAKADATAIMVFRQSGNTSTGDQQYYFWAP